MELKQNKKYIYFLILLIFLILSGFFSYYFKIFPEFDFYAFHYHNGWAFLNNRLNIDFMPATFRSYYNPVIDAVNFFVIQWLNDFPKLFIFLSGFKYGFFMFMCYLFFDTSFKIDGIQKKVAIVSSLLFVFFTPVAFSVLGIEWIDLQISSLILISLFIFFNFIFRDNSKQKFLLLFLSAFIMGISAGLKFSALGFCAAIILCTFFNYKNINNFFKTLSIIILGIISGFLLTDGYWLYEVYKKFSNPVFPYLNNIFQSPMGVKTFLYNYDFYHLHPNSLQALLLSPFSNTSYGQFFSMSGFFDLKISLTAILSCIYLFLNYHSSKFNEYLSRIVEPKYFHSIVLLIIFSFFINTFCFGYARYILYLLPFVSILIVTLAYISSSYLKDKRINVFISLFIVLFAAMNYIFWANYIKLAAFSVFVMCLSFILLVFVYYSKSISSKNFYIILILLTSLLVGTTRMTELNCSFESDFNPDKIVSVEGNIFEDKSVVLCSTMLDGFLLPHLNDKATFITYPLQDKYQKNRLAIEKQAFDTLSEYSSPYMVKMVQDLFNKEGSLYIISSDPILYFIDDMKQDLYNESLSDYLNKPFVMGEDNCKKIDYMVFGSSDVYVQYWFCKLK